MDANCERNPRHDRFRCRCHLERANLRQIYGIRFRHQLDPDDVCDHSGPPVAIAERRLGRVVDPTARELIRDASIRKEGTHLRLSRRPLVSAMDAPLSVVCKSRSSSIPAWRSCDDDSFHAQPGSWPSPHLRGDCRHHLVGNGFRLVVDCGVAAAIQSPAQRVSDVVNETASRPIGPALTSGYSINVGEK